VTVLGVIKKNGVSDTTVDVKLGVGVAVFKPANVGVPVKVGVGIVGVELGISVGVFVKVSEGVKVAAGIKNSCSIVSEQEVSHIEQNKKINTFFM
jgi:hypothetical protein